MPDFPEKYQNVKVLAEAGRNADVFKAYNSFLNRDVFLKVYPLPDDDPASALTEPHLLQELDSSHVVKVRYVDKVASGAREDPKPSLLIAMDWADGGSVQKKLDGCEGSGELLSLHTAVEWTIHAASGLADMHDKNLVHCDVKPANLVVDQGEVKVTDLGLARRLSSRGRAGGSKHARIYRPPEVWSGLGYSVQSDIYQVGICLYQLLGGPIDHKTLGKMDDMDLKKVICGFRLVRVHLLPPHLPTKLITIIRKCTGDEKDRYSTMRELILELQEVRLEVHNYVCKRTASGFEVSYPRHGGTRTLILSSRISKEHRVKMISSGLDGSQKTFRAEQVITHNNLHSCRLFRDLLRVFNG